MIDFKCNQGDLKKAIFGGALEDVVVELALEISLIYGSIASRNESAAKTFKELMIHSMVDAELQQKLFSSEIFEAVTSNENVGHITIVGGPELDKQVRELIEETMGGEA